MIISKTRISASILGIFAGIGGGIFHGVGEILQGSVAPSGMYIEAWPVLQTTAGEPAMTIVPNFFLTGILAIIMGIIITIWAVAFIDRKNGGLVLVFLSIAMLLLGGGIVPPIIGVIGGIIGSRIKPVME